MPDIKIYTLSTCSHCNAAKRFLNANGVRYEFTDVDLLAGEKQKALLEEVRKLNPDCTFPTIVVGKRVIVGIREKEIREALGL